MEGKITCKKIFNQILIPFIITIGVYLSMSNIFCMKDPTHPFCEWYILHIAMGILLVFYGIIMIFFGVYN